MKNSKDINIVVDINSDLLNQAEMLKIDISKVLEIALKEKLEHINNKNI